MRYCFFTLFLLFAGIAALANEEHITGVSGNVERLGDKHTSVRMVRESVQMDIYPEFYDVAVEFLFDNDGLACSVKMGFPEESDSDEGDFTHDSSFLRFRTWVDGQQAAAKRIKAVVSAGGASYSTYWVKTVTFNAHQSRTIRVEYRSSYGGNSRQETCTAVYNFSGGNWKGQIESSALAVVMHLTGVYAVDFSEPMTRTANRFTYRWTNWQAEDYFRVTFLPSRPDALRLSGKNIELLPISDYCSFYLLNQPGPQMKPRWMPPLIERNSHPFISINAWYAFFNNLANDDDFDSPPPNTELRVTVQEDKLTHAVKLTTDGRTVHFALKHPVMEVDGGKPVDLPETPFLSKPVGSFTGEVFVPLESLAEFFGATVKVNMETRMVELKIPPAPAKAKVKHEEKDNKRPGKPLVPANKVEAAGRWPWTSQRLATDCELVSMSDNELELMRNEIYARHGWVFQRKELQDYFSKQPWYQAKGSSENRATVNLQIAKELSAIERSNIDRSIRVEKRRMATASQG